MSVLSSPGHSTCPDSSYFTNTPASWSLALQSFLLKTYQLPLLVTLSLTIYLSFYLQNRCWLTSTGHFFSLEIFFLHGTLWSTSVNDLRTLIPSLSLYHPGRPECLYLMIKQSEGKPDSSEWRIKSVWVTVQGRVLTISFSSKKIQEEFINFIFRYKQKCMDPKRQGKKNIKILQQ